MANDELVEQVEAIPVADESLVKEGDQRVIVQDQHKPEDIAAAFFKLNKAKLERQLSQLSAKQLRRVIFNSCSYPFVDKEYKPRTDEEKQVAYTVSEMMLNRTIMQLSFEMNAADEALKKQENDVKLEETKEENNGKV